MKLKKLLNVTLSFMMCFTLLPFSQLYATSNEKINETKDAIVTTVNFTESNKGTGVNQISFKGEWIYESGVNHEYESDGFYLKNYNTLNTTNGFDIQFEGNKIEVYGIKEDKSSILSVSVDEISKGDFDCYSLTKLHQQNMISVDGLKDGKHTLHVRTTGKNGQSKGYAAYVDFIKVYKNKGEKIKSYTLEKGKDFAIPFDKPDTYTWTSSSSSVAVKNGVVSAKSNGKATITAQKDNEKYVYDITVVSEIQRNDETYDFTKINDGITGNQLNQFNFSNGWGKDSNINTLYQKDGHWTAQEENVRNCYYEFKFMGEKISIYGNKEPVLGIAEVYIDDELMGSIDMYAKEKIYQQLHFESPLLDANKQHTLKVKMTGNKNSKASGVEGYVDYVEVVKKNVAVYPTAIQLPESLSLEVGAAKDMNITFTPEDTNRRNIEWEIENENIVKADGTNLIAKEKGSTKVKAIGKDANGKNIVSNVCNVTVKDGNKYFHGGYGTTNKTYFLNMYNELMNAEPVMNNTVTGWKKDRVYSEIVLLTKNQEFDDLQVEASDFTNNGQVITSNFIKPSFLKYTKAAQYGPAGANGTMTPDIIYGNKMSVSANTVVPIWVEMNIPENVQAGTYTGKIIIKDNKGKELISFDQSIEVLNIVQPSVTEKGSYYLELWNYIQSSARYYGVKLLSPEHLAILKPHLQQYKENAGKTVMATICEEPWNHQTYDDSPSMVKWTKKANGKFEFDYTLFDKYAKFVFDNDLAENISCYSIVPWENRIIYFDEKENKQVEKRYHVGSKEWTDTWTQFLTDFTKHVDSKNWFDHIWMAMDERGKSDMQHAINLINSIKNKNGKSFKISGAFNQVIGDIWEQMYHVSPNINSVLNYGADRFRDLADKRKKEGLITTMYTCTGNRPNLYNLYDPCEAAWTIWMGENLHTDGFMRWAYDSWVEDPLNDASHSRFETGDVQMVYPGDKEDLTNGKVPVTRSAPRTERLYEAIRDVQKLRYLKEMNPSMSHDIDAFIGSVKNFNGSRDTVAIAKEMDRVKKGVMDLTRVYLNGNKLDNTAIDATLQNGTEKDERLFVNDGDLKTAWNANAITKDLYAEYKFKDLKDINKLRLYLNKNDNSTDVSLYVIDEKERRIPVDELTLASDLTEMEKQYQVYEVPYIGLAKGFEVKVQKGSKVNIHELMTFENNPMLDKKQMNIVASSQETESEDGKASNMIDGNNGSIWHSKYTNGIDSVPFTITLDLGKIVALDRIDFLPRQAGNNGIITKYDLKIAETENNYRSYKADGVWAEDSTVKTVDFNGEKVRYIQLIVKEAKGNFGSLAEITVYEQPLNSEGYNVQRAIKAVEKAEKTLVIKDIETAKFMVDLLEKSSIKDELIDRLNKLEQLDKTNLQELYDKLNSYNEKNYTVSTWKVFDLAMSKAHEVLETAKTHDEIDNAYESLKNANQQLVKRGDVTELNTLVQNNSARKKLDYKVTEDQWKEFLTLLANAQIIVKNNSNSSQADVDAAKVALEKVIALLDANKIEPEVKPTPDLKPESEGNKPASEKPEVSTRPGTPAKSENDKVENEEKPNTGVSMNTTLLWTIVLGAGIATVALKKFSKVIRY